MYFRYQGKEFCDYSNPRNGEAWFCNKPVSDQCSPIKMISFNNEREYLFKEPVDIRNMLNNFYHSYQFLKGNGFTVNVLPTDEETDSAILNRIRRNVGVENQLRNSTTQWPDGLGFRGQWVSLTDTYDRPTKEILQQCFANKVVYIIGDSTMLQFFTFFSSSLSLTVTESDKPRNYYHRLRVGRNAKLNTTFYYRAHGPPVRLLGTSGICPYVSDTIDSIQGGEGVVIFFNIGLHVLEYDPMIFIHRLNGIKKSLKFHLKKYSKTIVVIKGHNVTVPYTY